MLPDSLRRPFEVVSLLVAALCVLVAVVERLFAVHLLGRVDTLLELAIVGLLAALWAQRDETRSARSR